jgi:hypothetical protein
MVAAVKIILCLYFESIDPETVGVRTAFGEKNSICMNSMILQDEEAIRKLGPNEA